MAATDFQMQPLDLSCPQRKIDHGLPPEDLSSRTRRRSTSPPPLTSISPPPLTIINAGIHPRIRIRADLTNTSRVNNSSRESYHMRRRTTGDYEEDHDSSISVDDKPTDLRSNRRDEISRPVGNPRKRFLSKYLHNDVSGDDSLVDEGVEHDRPMHPGKNQLSWKLILFIGRQIDS